MYLREPYAHTRRRIHAHVKAQMSWGEWARRVGVTKGTISLVWNGKRDVSFAVGYRMATAAGISMDDLYAALAAPAHSIHRKKAKYWQHEAIRKRRVEAQKQAEADATSVLATQYKETAVR